MKKYSFFYLIALAIILLDQSTKLLVHFNMRPYQDEIPLLGNWLKISYVLNAGMAFGITLSTPYGKLILTVFRIIAVIAIIYYIKYLVDKKAHKGFIVSIAMILAGALGNAIDSIFYGVFLGNAPDGSPTPWFHGQVIDMIYVDIWKGIVPNWIPIIGGEYYALWPVFNIADSAIFVAVTIIFIWQGSFFEPKKGEEEEVKTVA
ncbi:MAG: lipoprotein signal peptidase [Cytophagales bacterium]|nr:MAG: lipoprotein signal peptidase [Cytophagales bacterium]